MILSLLSAWISYFKVMRLILKCVGHGDMCREFRQKIRTFQVAGVARTNWDGTCWLR